MVLTLSQLAILVLGTLMIAPLATTAIFPWHYDNTDNKYYCERSLIFFIATYFPLMWTLLILTVALYVFILIN